MIKINLIGKLSEKIKFVRGEESRQETKEERAKTEGEYRVNTESFIFNSDYA